MEQTENESTVYSEIKAFIRSRTEGLPITVNDSFSTLDLRNLGLRRLFSSPWSVRPPGEIALEAPEGLQIQRVTTPELMAEFDRACSVGFGSPDSVRVYLDSLLNDPRYRIHVGLSDGQVVTGAMAFENGTSVGLYSLFTLPEARNRGFGKAIARSVMMSAKRLPAITNPSDLSKDLFSRLGFESVGTRTVWLKD